MPRHGPPSPSHGERLTHVTARSLADEAFSHLPELSIIKTPLTSPCNSPSHYHVEYRVYNYRFLSSGRIIRGDGWGWLDYSILLGLIGSGVLDVPDTWYHRLVVTPHIVCVVTLLRLKALPDSYTS